jgi:hypothetical protein
MQFCNSALQLREGGRADVPDTRSPKFWRVTLPIGFAHPKLGSNSLSRARERAGETRRVAAPSRPVPKNSGRRGGAFSFSPAERGLRGAILASLALAQASETEANSSRIWCRSEGILNQFIVSKSGWIHKAKTLGGFEFIAFLFSCLRGVVAADARCFEGP